MHLSTMLPRLLLAAGFLLLPLGCGSETGGSSTTGDGGVDDGKYHPEGNGQRIGEEEACAALRDAQNANVKRFSDCIATTRPCPDLVRSQAGGTHCLQYDQGSVQGCVDYYASKNSCDDVSLAFDECVVTSFAGSEPAGCPTE